MGKYCVASGGAAKIMTSIEEVEYPLKMEILLPRYMGRFCCPVAPGCR
jgi:hypothetical protein